MPKMKTHKGAASRFRVTGGGKIMRMQGHRNNFRRKKWMPFQGSLRSNGGPFPDRGDAYQAPARGTGTELTRSTDR